MKTYKRKDFKGPFKIRSDVKIIINFQTQDKLFSNLTLEMKDIKKQILSLELLDIDIEFLILKNTVSNNSTKNLSKKLVYDIRSTLVSFLEDHENKCFYLKFKNTYNLNDINNKNNLTKENFSKGNSDLKSRSIFNKELNKSNVDKRFIEYDEIIIYVDNKSVYTNILRSLLFCFYQFDIYFPNMFFEECNEFHFNRYNKYLEDMFGDLYLYGKESTLLCFKNPEELSYESFSNLCNEKQNHINHDKSGDSIYNNNDRLGKIQLLPNDNFTKKTHTGNKIIFGLNTPDKKLNKIKEKDIDKEGYVRLESNFLKGKESKNTRVDIEADDDAEVEVENYNFNHVGNNNNFQYKNTLIEPKINMKDREMPKNDLLKESNMILNKRNSIDFGLNRESDLDSFINEDKKVKNISKNNNITLTKKLLLEKLSQDKITKARNLKNTNNINNINIIGESKVNLDIDSVELNKLDPFDKVDETTASTDLSKYRYSDLYLRIAYINKNNKIQSFAFILNHKLEISYVLDQIVNERNNLINKKNTLTALTSYNNDINNSVITNYNENCKYKRKKYYPSQNISIIELKKIDLLAKFSSLDIEEDTGLSNNLNNIDSRINENININNFELTDISVIEKHNITFEDLYLEIS
jgi:hypothetical protein